MSSSSMFYCGGCEDQYEEPHFLEACFLCHKPLRPNTDIFMYRGNTAFCSKECREEQIEMDEAKEKSWKRASKRSVRQSDQTNTNSSSSSSSSSPNKTVRTGTLVVA